MRWMLIVLACGINVVASAEPLTIRADEPLMVLRVPELLPGDGVRAHDENDVVHESLLLDSFSTDGTRDSSSVFREDGAEVSVIGDVDGDGVDDLFVSHLGKKALSGGGSTNPDGDVDQTLSVVSGKNYTVIRSIVIPTRRLGFGISFMFLPRLVGDVDGDGIRDIFTREIIFLQNPHRRGGIIECYSGATLELIWSIEESLPDGSVVLFGGGIESRNDVNNDGAPDIIQVVGIDGREPNTYLQAMSGRDGSIIWERVTDERASFFVLLAPLQDLNGDGMFEFALTTQKSLLPKTGIYDGKTGALVRSFAMENIASSPRPEFRPRTMISVPDQDGDGVDDLLIKDGAFVAPFPSERWVVRLVSSLDGSILHTFVDPYPFRPKQITQFNEYGFGSDLIRLPDITGDGVDEFVITNASAVVSFVFLDGIRVRAWVYDGKTLAVVRRITSYGTASYYSEHQPMINSYRMAVSDVLDKNGTMRQVLHVAGFFDHTDRVLSAFELDSVSIADVSGDGRITGRDLTYVLERVGTTSTEEEHRAQRLDGDLDDNNRVDTQDVRLLIELLGEPATSGKRK